MNLFLELSSIIVIATLFGFLMKLLKQPLMVGYILAGILVGPHIMNVMHGQEQLDVFSKIGITVLLFILGLKLNPTVIREVGKVSLITGLGQIIVTTIIGYGLAMLIGMDHTSAIYMSVALTFSSTIVVLKLLTDKGDLHRLYGKIAVGFLLVQDIVATFILIFVSSFSNAGTTNIFFLVSSLLLKGLTLFILLYFASKYVIPFLSKFSATSKELLFLFSVTWGFGLSSLFYLLGFSIETGALIAGVTLSMSPFAYQIGVRLKALRDFFIVVFFVLLGSQIELNTLQHMLVPLLVFSLYVLIGNPLIMIVLMHILGYKRKTGFLVGVSIAQISEFSLIFAALGYSLGQIGSELVSLLTMIGLITIAGSSYMVIYAEKLYPHIEPWLKRLEFSTRERKEESSPEQKYDAILFGYDKVGRDFVQAFDKLGLEFLVVDFNPHLIESMEKDNVPYRYGDAEDPEFLRELHLSKVKMIVSTIPDFKVNLQLTKQLKEANPQAIPIVLSHQITHAEELYKAGAIYVVMPHYLGARYASNMIVRIGLDREAFKEEREKHRERLLKRTITEADSSWG